MVCSIVFLRYQLLCHAIDLDMLPDAAPHAQEWNSILLSDGQIRHAKTTLPFLLALSTKKTI